MDLASPHEGGGLGWRTIVRQSSVAAHSDAAEVTRRIQKANVLTRRAKTVTLPNKRVR